MYVREVEGVDWVFFAFLDQTMLVIEEFFSCDWEGLKPVTRVISYTFSLLSCSLIAVPPFSCALTNAHALLIPNQKAAKISSFPAWCIDRMILSLQPFTISLCSCTEQHLLHRALQVFISALVFTD